MRKDRLLFSVRKNGRADVVYYQEEPLYGSRHLRESRKVLRAHVIPDMSERSLRESLIFAIANQFIDFEIPVRLLHSLQRHSLRDICGLEAKVLRKIVAAAKFRDDRCSPAFDYVTRYRGGIEQLAKDYLAEPSEVREILEREVRWIGPKTASFWYLCLGGRDLMTLDVHNLRQLPTFGVRIKKSHYAGKIRGEGNPNQSKMTTGGLNIRTTPQRKEYLDIERRAIRRLEKFPEFSDRRGSFDPALATTVLWWAGAKHKRGIKLSALNYVSPYSRVRKS